MTTQQQDPIIAKLKVIWRRAQRELAIAFQPNAITGMLREAFEVLNPDMVSAMIERDVAWPINDDLLGRFTPFKEDILDMSPDRIIELLEMARPDLVDVVMASPKGIIWFALNVEVLKNSLRGIQVVKPADEAQPQVVVLMATCPACQQEYPVLQDKVDQVTGCPYCQAPPPEPEQPKSEEPELRPEE